MNPLPGKRSRSTASPASSATTIVLVLGRVLDPVVATIERPPSAAMPIVEPAAGFGRRR
jgi:hypothetical protein